MMLSTILKAGVIGGFGIMVSSDIIESKMIKYDTDVLKPVDKVSIIVPSFNEEQFVGTALSSIRNQSIIEKYPDYFELILVDSGSKDDTVRLATPYVDKTITINVRGKLTARNLSSDCAKGNIIVSADADAYYPYHWLNSLLVPFNDYTNPKYENIVGVFGSTFDYTVPYVPGKLFSFGDAFYSRFVSRNRMTGRNSAFWKHAFYLADKFDETVNQLNIWSIFHEEENLFGNRLSRFGKITYKLNAPCYHMGGYKTIGRIGIGDKKLIDKHKFGEERF